MVKQGQAALVSQPASEGGDSGAPRDGRAQAKLEGGAARIRDVVALISGPPIGEGKVNRAAEQVFDIAEQLPQADGVAGTAAEVEGAALHGIDAPPCGEI